MKVLSSYRLGVAGTVVVIIAGIVGFSEKVLERFAPPVWATLSLVVFVGVLGALSFVIPYLKRRAVRSSYLEKVQRVVKAKPLSSVFIMPPCEVVELPQPRSADAKPPPDDIQEALSESRHIVIEGNPGTGKSTVLNNIVLGRISTGHNGRALPVMVEAEPLAAMKDSLPTSLLKLVTADLGLSQESELPKNFFEIRPPRGSWMVLLDGLDKIGSRERRKSLMQSLRIHIEAKDSVYRFVVTTRPLGDDPHLFDQFRRYRLLPFRLEQVKEWAKQWSANRPDASPDEGERFLAMWRRYTEVMQIPLLLRMAARLYESDHVSQLPTRRAALYEKYLAVQLNDDQSLGEKRKVLRKQWEDRYGAQAIQWADAVFNARRKLLEHLADWRKQNGGARALGDEATNYWFARGLVPKDDVDRQWLCDQAENLLLGTGLLAWSTGEITFAHDTFREYLAAFKVANRSEPDENATRALLSRWRDSGWREVVLFALGIWSEKGNDLTDDLKTSIDLTSREGLEFAGAALAEGVRLDRRFEDEIVDRLVEARALEVLRVLYRRERVTDGLRSLACDRACNPDPWNRALAAEALGVRARAEGAKAVLEEARAILLDISQEPGGDPGDVLQPLDAICRLGSDEAAILFTELARRGDPHGQAVPYLMLLKRFDKVLELLQDRAIGLETRRWAVYYAVEAASNATNSEVVPVLRDLLRNSEQFSLGLEERVKIEKTLQTLAVKAWRRAMSLSHFRHRIADAARPRRRGD
jgi:hypothetical protein